MLTACPKPAAGLIVLVVVFLASMVVIARVEEKPQETDLVTFAPAPDSSRGPWSHPDALTLKLWSEAAGVPTFLTYAIAWRETRNNPSPWVRGAHGEVGRFQIRALTARSRCPGIDVGMYDGNLACFLRMAQEDLRTCAGDARCASRVHNGSGPKARAYADSVMADVKKLVERRVGK